MSVIQVGLVDTTGQLDAKLAQATAAALNVQVIRDLAQFWEVTATVRYLPDPKQIPVGVWPVFLVANLPPGEGGVHLDKKNQPYALVIGTPTSADWTIDASHETLEMLVDPAGNRLQVSRAIEIAGADVRDANGQFEYLVEACDPCEGSQYAYTIQGIAVSDFITPRFYDPVATPSARSSRSPTSSRSSRRCISSMRAGACGRSSCAPSTTSRRRGSGPGLPCRCR